MLTSRARSKEAKENKKMIIIDSAKNLFLSSEFSIPTMTMIASESRMTKGNVYNYFPTKEELYIFILKEEFKEWFYSVQSIEQYNQEEMVTFFVKLFDNRLLAKLYSNITHLLKSTQVKIDNKAYMEFNNFFSSHIDILSEKLAKEVGISKQMAMSNILKSIIAVSGKVNLDLITFNKEDVDNNCIEILKSIWSRNLF